MTYTTGIDECSWAKLAIMHTNAEIWCQILGTFVQ